MLQLLLPLSYRRFREIVAVDPRWPGPVAGGARGSKAIYSRAQVLGYLDLVATQGFPHLEGKQIDLFHKAKGTVQP